MARSARETTSSSDSSASSTPFTQSLRGGLKRVMDFFVVSEDALSEAGVNLGYSDKNDPENPEDPSVEISESELF